MIHSRKEIERSDNENEQVLPRTLGIWIIIGPKSTWMGILVVHDKVNAIILERPRGRTSGHAGPNNGHLLLLFRHDMGRVGLVKVVVTNLMRRKRERKRRITEHCSRTEKVCKSKKGKNNKATRVSARVVPCSRLLPKIRIMSQRQSRLKLALGVFLLVDVRLFGPDPFVMEARKLLLGEENVYWE